MSENYGNAEFLHEQRCLTDLIPTRPVTLAAVLLAGAIVVGVLVELYLLMPRVAAGSPGGRIAALDLAQRGSLATWCSSTMLAAAGLTAIIIYTIRRHKRDDYHGRYRVWLWAAVCWIVMSMDATAGVRYGLGGALAALAGTPLFGDGAIWWIAGYGFFVGGIGTRLAVDMRSCRLSTATLVLSAVGYAFGAVLRLGMLTGWTVESRIAAIQGAMLSANLLVLMAMLVHARHVLLDAQGRLPRRRREEEPDEEDQGESEEDEVARGGIIAVHPPHAAPRPISPAFAGNRGVQPGPAAPLVAVQKTAAVPLVAAPVQRKLTKQEKKALRDRLDRMRQQREQAG